MLIDYRHRNAMRDYLADLFHILELVARKAPMDRNALAEEVDLSYPVLDERLADLRDMGINIDYDQEQRGYRILSWGVLLRPEAIRNGLWRHFFGPSPTSAEGGSAGELTSSTPAGFFDPQPLTED